MLGHKYVIAQFPYVAKQPDELSFNKHDRIKLISKDAGDPGWWKGEINGKTGVFPDNFVKEDLNRKTISGSGITGSNSSVGAASNAVASSNAAKLRHAGATNTNFETPNKNTTRPQSEFFGTQNTPSTQPVIEDNFNKKNRAKGPQGKRPPARGNRKSEGNDIDLWDDRAGNTKPTSKPAGKMNIDSDEETNQNREEEDPNKSNELNSLDSPAAQTRNSIKDRMQKIAMAGGGPGGPGPNLFLNQDFHNKINARRDKIQAKERKIILVYSK